MAAPTPKYTVEQMVEALAECKGRAYQAAARLGCHVNTVLKYKGRHQAIQDVCVQKEGERLDAAEDKLDAAVEKGEAWAVCFLLKTRGKSRGYVERQELTGPDGEALPAVEVVVRTREEAKAMLARLEHKEHRGNGNGKA